MIDEKTKHDRFAGAGLGIEALCKTLFRWRCTVLKRQRGPPLSAAKYGGRFKEEMLLNGPFLKIIHSERSQINYS